MTIESVGSNAAATTAACHDARQARDTDRSGKARVQELFKKLDVNGDGSLTRTDLQAAFDTVTLSPQGVAAARSTQAAQAAPSTQAAAAAETAQGASTTTTNTGTAGVLDTLMARLDRNGDGTVTEREFGRALARASHGHHRHHKHHEGDRSSVSLPSTPGVTTTSPSGGVIAAAPAGSEVEATTAVPASSTNSTSTAGTSTPAATTAASTTTAAASPAAGTSAPGSTVSNSPSTAPATLYRTRLDTLFSKLDTNGDGTVSKQEFTDALRGAWQGERGHRVRHHHHHQHRHHHADAAATTTDAQAATASGSATAATPASRDSGAALMRVMKMLNVYAEAGSTAGTAAPAASGVLATA